MSSSANWEAVIGLEVHVQLHTQTKMFCSCINQYGGAANSQVCPVCLGMPGSLPVPNEEAIRKTILTGLMFGCRIAPVARFDRKNYFYPDMPKNYQISQFEDPLCAGARSGWTRFCFPKIFRIRTRPRRRDPFDSREFIWRRMWPNPFTMRSEAELILTERALP